MTLEPLLLLSRSLTAAVLVLALGAAGCDRESAKQVQPQAAAGGAQAAAGGAQAAAGGAQPAAKLDRTKRGAPLPAITVQDAGGKSLALASLRGKPVLINLWATWCAPCVVELPTLNALANRADLNLAVVTISQDMGSPEKIQPFLDQRGLAQLPAWLDAKGDLAFHYNTGTLPATILYDAAGKEVWRYAGERDWGSEESMALLAEGGAR
jgi:thiol-disulfide isomerase/thioredoxin